MANPSLQIGNDNWAIKEDNLLGYSTAGTRFVPQPITMTRATLGTRVNPSGLVEDVALLGSELITDGDFPTGTTAWSMTNNTGTNTRIENNHLIIETDGAYTQAEQLNVTVGGNQYKLVYTVLNSDGGDLALVTEGNTPSSIPNSVGTHIYYFTSHSTSFILKRRSGALNITITNISVKEATIDNLPRVDYTDGTSSLLVEPQRTNLVTYSEDFTDTYWNKLDGLTASSLAGGLSPDGLTNSDLITINNGRLNKDISVSNSTAYTLTAYFKGTVGETINMDLGASTKLITLTGLWQKESINLTTTSTFIPVNLIDNRSSGTASTVEVWGAQLEAGSYATSYIKTSGSTVTRNQETYEKTGISDLINSEEGVLFFEMAALSDDGTLRCITLSDGGITNRVLIIYDTQSNSIRAVVVSNAGTSFDELHTVTSTLDFHKIAIKWKLNDFALWIDGVEVATDTSGAAPIGLDRIVFDVGNGTYDFYGKVKQLQIYKTALTDSELATLTT